MKSWVGSTVGTPLIVGRRSRKTGFRETGIATAADLHHVAVLVLASRFYQDSLLIIIVEIYLAHEVTVSC